MGKSNKNNKTVSRYISREAHTKYENTLYIILIEGCCSETRTDSNIHLETTLKASGKTSTGVGDIINHIKSLIVRAQQGNYVSYRIM